MADSTSGNSGSGSGSSSESRSRIQHKTRPSLRPCWTNLELSTNHFEAPNSRALGEAVGHLQTNEDDRETAKRAVTILVRATRKRGVDGAIALCTEFAGLLQQNQRLERIISSQKSELRSLARKHKSPQSTRLKGVQRRATESKANQIRPWLVDRSTSPLIKEVYVKSSRNQSTQTDKIPDRGCTVEEGHREDEANGGVVQPEEKSWLKLVKENSELKNRLTSLTNGLESLKKKVSLPKISPESVLSKAEVPSSTQEDTQSNNYCQEDVHELTTQRQEQPVNGDIMFPHLPEAKNNDQKPDSKSRGCHPPQQRKALTLSSPVRAVPRQPIKPVDMYSTQCKHPGCARIHCEDNARVLCDSRHSVDKKSPKQSEILPCIGDHVVVKNHMTGVVRYIGPIVGDKKRQYAGLHLDSPVGDHNGSVNGIQYFSCPQSYGAFVPVDDILCITSFQTSSKLKQIHK